MKKLITLLVLLLISIQGFSTGTPESQYIVALNNSLSTSENRSLLQRIRIAVEREQNNFVLLENAIDESSLGNQTVKVEGIQHQPHFIITDILNDQEDGRSIIKIYEIGRPTPYYLEVKARDANNIQEMFTRLFLARYDNELYNTKDGIDFIVSISNKQFHYLRGLKLYSLNKHEEAIASFDKSIMQDSLDHRSFYGRALCYKKLNQKNEYKANLDTAIALNYQSGNYVNELGNYYLHNNDPHQALALYKQLITNLKYSDLAAWNSYVAFKYLNMEDSALAYLHKIQTDSKYYLGAQKVIAMENSKRNLTKRSENNRKNNLKNLQVGLKVAALAVFLSIIIYLTYSGFRKKTNLLEQKKELVGLIVSIITFIISSFDNILEYLF